MTYMNDLSREEAKTRPQWKALTCSSWLSSLVHKIWGIKGSNPFPGFAALQDRRIIKPRPQKFVEKESETKVHGLNCSFLHGKVTINLRPNKNFVFFSDASLFYGAQLLLPPHLPAYHVSNQTTASLWQSSSTQTVHAGRKKIKQHWQQCYENHLHAVHHTTVQWPAGHIPGSRWSTKPTGNPLRGFSNLNSHPNPCGSD